MATRFAASPAPTGVQHLAVDPERRVGERRGHHRDLAPGRLVGTAELVDHLQGRDPPRGPGRASAHDLAGRLGADVLEPASLEEGRELAPERLVVAANRPPVAVSPHPLVVVVRRVRGIDRSAGRCPVGVLVEEPAARAQARCHLPDRLFLASLEMEQHQPRADEVERTRLERVERVLEDVVLDNLEVRELEPRQVPGVDVGRHDVAGRADLRGQPHGHGATPRPDLETSPARLDQRPSLARDRIVDLLEEVQPVILCCLAACRGKPVVGTLSGRIRHAPTPPPRERNPRHWSPQPDGDCPEAWLSSRS